MKLEYFKEFNAAHAKAGAPYCQRNGLTARIGIWDGHREKYPLVGEIEFSPYTFGEASWGITGNFCTNPTAVDHNLVMIPLGYCEGKPVFVGDELVGTDNNQFEVTPVFSSYFDLYHWPRTAPVMPKSTYADHISAHPHGVFCYNTALEYELTNRRPEIEAYWKALDDYNGVKA